MSNLSTWGKVPVIGLARLKDAAHVASRDGFWKHDGEILSPVHDFLFGVIAATLMADGKLDQQEYELLATILVDPPGGIQEMQRHIAHTNQVWTKKHRQTPPLFFRGIVERDKARNSRHSLDAIMAVYATWTAFAVADGSITEIETALFNEYLNALSKAVAGAGIAPLPEIEALVWGPHSIVDFVRGATGDHVPFSLSELKGEPKFDDASRPDLDETLAELNALVGLERVKDDVKSLANFVRVRQLRKDRGLSVAPTSLHLVFLGNPGTGKTTVARILAKLYSALGLLDEGQLVETDRSGLVAGYVGQTALKVEEAVSKATGGVLFIDEAYSLAGSPGSNDYGQEAVEKLLKAMEDKRDELVVIVAGYEEKMNMFLSSNPGLKSRFNKFIDFPDYGPEELVEIFQRMARSAQYTLDPAAEQKVGALLRTVSERKGKDFGNARLVRNLFEQTLARHSDRVVTDDTPTADELCLITAADVPSSPVLH